MALRKKEQSSANKKEQEKLRKQLLALHSKYKKKMLGLLTDCRKKVMSSKEFGDLRGVIIEYKWKLIKLEEDYKDDWKNKHSKKK